MRPRTEWGVLTGLVVLTRAADGVSTVWATPDLARELNPIASGGWPALVAAAGVVVVLSTALHAHHLHRPVDLAPAVPGVDWPAFQRHYFDPHTNVGWQATPGRAAAYVFGYVMPRTLIVWSVLLVVNNVLTALPVEPYVALKRRYPVWLAVYGALPLLAILFVQRLQRRDFVRYRCTGLRSTPPRHTR